MLNTISVDVEEYFHATNIEDAIGRDNWPGLKSTVVTTTHSILEIFEQKQIKATFFILGFIAKKYPELVREINSAGHEIASHGSAHRLVYKQTEEEFFQDIDSNKKLLEDIIGEKILGYRAPNFSITEKTPWAHKQILNAGYLYDSSLFPVWHPRYANPNQPRAPFAKEIGKHKLYIFPLATAELSFLNFKKRLPVAGGTYWRIFPKFLIKQLMHTASKDIPLNCYFHPWDLDDEQPKFKELNYNRSIRHYTGTKFFKKTLSYYLDSFQFGSIKRAGLEYFKDEAFK